MYENFIPPILIISGPSGSGKTTLATKLISHYSSRAFVRSISCTTRAPRKGEKHGVDYYYLSSERFQQNINEGNFLEWAQYGTHYYGTPKSEINRAKQAMQALVMVIEVQGHEKVGNLSLPNKIVSIFLTSGEDELQLRLKDRGDISEDEIARRLMIAQNENNYRGRFSYVVENKQGDIQFALQELIKIVGSEFNGFLL